MAELARLKETVTSHFQRCDKFNFSNDNVENAVESVTEMLKTTGACYSVVTAVHIWVIRQLHRFSTDSCTRRAHSVSSVSGLDMSHSPEHIWLVLLAPDGGGDRPDSTRGRRPAGHMSPGPTP